jgi:hypothetical protein
MSQKTGTKYIQLFPPHPYLEPASSELEFLELWKLPVSTKPGVSLIGNAMKTKSEIENR